MTRLASRLASIEPFHVMDVLARARALEAEGRSIIHMEIGEPDFPTAQPIIDAGVAALRAGHTQYTPSLGLPELRAAIAASYPRGTGVDVSRVIVTPGASGALQLVLAALVNPGDEVLMADPGYPCNRHFVSLFEGRACTIAVDAATGYQLTADLIRERWSPRTVAVLLASPSNPTGTIVSDNEVARIAEAVRSLGGVLIVDEIYHGLVYDAQIATAATFGEDIFIVNSFSKYYGMTGWRVGWMVAPKAYVDAIDRLAQNIFIAAGTPSQYAALVALSASVRAELEQRRERFRERRDFLLPALRELGFGVPVTPQGAFYIYADCSAFTTGSEHFALELLQQSGVAITPGRDFGRNVPERFVRFSYANTLENLREGVRRIAAQLRRG
jgi:aspartate/methionine/tyrosine aminotransferase